ncbi:putative autotransporter adhesin-like protein [Gelidibacter algens]|uniref:Putative autotransporter adhesin-like protein n=1 Tax=Gelidibacter algens TaxID=49280 RepID=A0A327S9M9_9FLAO|nr:head GIN domain-containing protein [Gelidibacter algens]RAJ25641.1 putative autotransporter adhesin-like protein [Gelidibacter algens]
MKIVLMIVSLFLGVHSLAQEGIEKNIGDFDELKVYDLINVTLVKSDNNKAIISGDHKSDVELVNSNGTLKIKMRLGEKFDGNKTNVTLYYRDIQVIDVNEGAYVTSEDTFKQYEIELRAQEGGVIKLMLEVSENEVKAVTGGQIEVSGKALRQDISINTGGIFNGKTLETESTHVAIRAAGEAHINASKLADIKVRAGGDVYIYGNPETVNESKVLGGRIKRMN